LGGYGMMFFLFYLCNRATVYFSPIIIAYTIINIVYGSIAALVQTDLKRIIAYSSIAHMGLVVLGIFSIEYNAFIGSIYQMLAHGITSAGLFFLVGFMYDRLSVRNVSYFGGLVMVMPLFAIGFFFFTLGNISFPGTANFVGELLLFVGIFKTNPVGGVIALFGAFLSTVYSV
jgi:NADH-quinone oxidoreductase subunit M